MLRISVLPLSMYLRVQGISFISFYDLFVEDIGFTSSCDLCVENIGLTSFYVFVC